MPPDHDHQRIVIVDLPAPQLQKESAEGMQNIPQESISRISEGFDDQVADVTVPETQEHSRKR